MVYIILIFLICIQYLQNNREDIKLKKYAQSKGWNVIYSTQDILDERYKNPKNELRFQKDSIVIWKCGETYPTIKIWWQARNVNNGIYEPYNTRREYNTLKEAIDNESSVKS